MPISILGTNRCSSAKLRILEVRLPSGKPGDGAQVLRELVERPGPDQRLLQTDEFLAQRLQARCRAFSVEEDDP